MRVALRRNILRSGSFEVAWLRAVAAQKDAAFPGEQAGSEP